MSTNVTTMKGGRAQPGNLESGLPPQNNGHVLLFKCIPATAEISFGLTFSTSSANVAYAISSTSSVTSTTSLLSPLPSPSPSPIVVSSIQGPQIISRETQIIYSKLGLAPTGIESMSTTSTAIEEVASCAPVVAIEEVASIAPAASRDPVDDFTSIGTEVVNDSTNSTRIGVASDFTHSVSV
ncbi:hypothetical protein ACH5RR_013511 [Cinchona calisaya]|uniref:Uncharacterized protein n=1 Tax=Cinchona calisaya TaxID=153742 RepID=A0ABD3A1M1_9GENT